LFCAAGLLGDLIFPFPVANAVAALGSGSSGSVGVVWLTAGLICYFLGATTNAVSNRLIRTWMAGYRRRMIRRKLGLSPNETVDDLHADEQKLISVHLPDQKSKDTGDKLNELYAASRTFCSLFSDRSARAIDYHWSLMRLSRASLLPLMVLAGVCAIRLGFHHARLANVTGVSLALVLLGLTFSSYIYREKFLIYTVFDTFFESAKSETP
jgi:hypothetical protein